MQLLFLLGHENNWILCTNFDYTIFQLRKHTYSNIFKIVQNCTTKKKENFQIKKNPIFFHISAQNIDCGCLLEPPQWGSSNEYP